MRRPTKNKAKTYRGTLLKRGARWWWRIAIGGTRHSRSFEAPTRAAAIDRIDELLAKVRIESVARTNQLSTMLNAIPRGRIPAAIAYLAARAMPQP